MFINYAQTNSHYTLTLFDTITAVVVSDTHTKHTFINFKHSLYIYLYRFLYLFYTHNFNRECFTKTLNFFPKKKRARPGELSDEVYNV